VPEPTYSHDAQRSFGTFSGLPQAVLQAQKESSGKQRTINLFYHLSHASCTMKNYRSGKNLEFEMTTFDHRV